ncbi:hypothetical protein C8R44DRAFT_375208 [Mycena epipterygia]|nr:hypothetical protein C8R44DRAFT_375208 [Mycena epipterygia]
MASTLVSVALLVSACVAGVLAESHTVKFDNRCGYGTPQLIKGGDILSTTSYTSTGELAAAIAYLQTGSCGFNGEKCTLLELTLVDSVAVGAGSSADISLIDPHTFSVPTRIQFYGVCDGISTTCDSPGCTTAFKQPDDTWVQIACQEDNANLLITFCPDEGSSSSNNTTVQHTSTTKAKTTTKMTTTTSSKIATTVASVTPVTHGSTPTTAASSSSTSASMCKHKRSERRAINAHRRSAGQSFRH